MSDPRLSVRKTYKLYLGGKVPRTESGRSYLVSEAKGRPWANACRASRKDVRDAVVAALEMVERTAQAGLPPAHVGLHAGPVVFQDGDYFGRTVNLAARIAGHAQAGQVLVSDQVVAECGDGTVAFEPIGPVPLKGVADPVPLHRATRQAPGG